MAQKRITVTEDSNLHTVKLEQSPTIWRSWKFQHTHLLIALRDNNVQRDLSKCGVYFLLSDTNDGRFEVYVGESANTAMRLKQHHDRPPFEWTEAMVFTSSDDYLEKSHIRYLERALYECLSKSSKAILKNGNVPGGAKVRDKETLNDFIETIESFTVNYGYRGLFDTNASNASIAKTQATTVQDIPINTDDVLFKVGVIMKYAFRKAISSGRLPDAEIKRLLDVESATIFKMNTKIPLLVTKLPNDKYIRYYRDGVIWKKNTYFISREFLERSKSIVISYLKEHGMSIKEINEACAEGVVERTKSSKVTASPSCVENPSTTIRTIDSKKETFPYKVGCVMRYAFTDALKKGLFSHKDIAFLLSRDASRFFKTRGYPVLAPESFPRKDHHGINRFAAQTVECRGRHFLVTTQVYKEGLPIILDYLNKHGLSNMEIQTLCSQCDIHSRKRDDRTKSSHKKGS